MKKAVIILSLLLILLTFHSLPSIADVRLPALISDNMVLQRDMKVHVWGWADPEEEIIVTIEEQKLTAKAGSDGKWMVNLEPMTAGGPFELVIEGNNTIKLSNVLIGEVWICSGQSNMEWMVKHSDNADIEIADAGHPKIRLFSIRNNVSPEPLEDCEAMWKVCRPSTVGSFSGTGYFFGREIMKELDVAVGLINTSWGGTSAEVWISTETLTSNPDLKGIVDRWKPVLSEKTPEIIDYYRKMGDWHEDVYHIVYAKKPFTPQKPPEAPVKLTWVPTVPTWVYNAMIAPLVPYAIRGAIWYQGESNSGRAYQYRKLLPALIEDWRRVWGQGDFPFLFVQLANYMKADAQPQQSAWAELREAQLMTLTLPNTAMAVTIDIGDPENIHPGNKQDVGRRLALGALKVAYNKGIVHSGPLYDSMTVKDGKIRLRFTQTGSGLVVKNGESPEGFAIAGEDKKFVWADAVIEGDEVVVWNDEVTEPVAVRYAWANNPVCNLYNREGLPASPFRTDNWQGITADKQ